MLGFVAVISLIINTFCYCNETEKTVLITGGAGFIGSNFSNYMYEKYPNYKLIILDSLTYSSSTNNIRNLIDSERVEFVHDSICNGEVVDELMSRSDFVVHFAAESDVTRSIADDYVFFESNVMGTRELLHKLVKYKDTVERFIHISSSEVYGTCEGEFLSENDLLKPMSPYAASKAGADRAVYAYGCTYDVPVCVLRFFNNYGPRQHVEKLVSKFITSAILNKPITVHGTGEQMRDWIFVVDTARAIDAALHLEDFSAIKNEVINCGTGKTLSVLQIANVVKKIFDLDSEQIIFVSDRPGQVHKHQSSVEKARRLLNWCPITNFEDGMKLTVEWYKSNPEFWEEMINMKEIYKDNNVLIYEKQSQ